MRKTDGYIQLETQEEGELLESLADMWEQYCPPPYTHACMSAGEGCEDVLNKFGILRPSGHINWEELQQLRNGAPHK